MMHTYGEWDESDFLTDEDGNVEIFMRVYPDNSDYEGYHPGDNFVICCVVGDTGYLSDTTYPLTSWKKMRIEYDYMEGCTLSTIGFTTIERAFKGENILYGGSRNYNHCTYLEFKEDSTHLFRSDANINSYAFDFTKLELQMKEFFASYRSDSIQYPFYHIGACSLAYTPDTLNIHGQCLYRISMDSLNYTPYMSTVYISKIINDFDGELTEWQLKAAIGLISSHELGHFAAQLTDAYLEPGDHTDPAYCIMIHSGNIAENMRYGNNMYFCPACIRLIRGVMYVRGPQVF